jgi:hypothetical protein
MLALGLALPAAAAEPCEDVAARVDAAWTAFDDAELGMAADVLDSAIQELSCQSRLLSADELFELFELDALVSLGNEDEDRAVYAIIRAVTVDPTRGTSPENGPALAALHETWQKRLSGVRVRVQVAGQQALYLDGRPIAPGATVEVVAGEHLLQLEEADGVYSEVLELESDAGIVTSPRQPGAAFATTSLAPLVPDPVPTPPRRRKVARQARPRCGAPVSDSPPPVAAPCSPASCWSHASQGAPTTTTATTAARAPTPATPLRASPPSAATRPPSARSTAPATACWGSAAP